MIQDDSLLGVSWDTSHIQNVLSEVLTLFQNQNQRIALLEEKVANTAPKDLVDRLNNEVDELATNSAAEFETLRQRIATNKDDINTKVSDLRDWAETQFLTNLGETRRLMTNELANYIPVISESDPIIASLKDKVEDCLKKTNNLLSDFDSATIPSVGQAKSPEEIGSIRMAQFDKRVSEIEQRLATYETVESDLNSLQLQFPVTVKRLERKINDILQSQGQGSFQLPPMPSPQPLIDRNAPPPPLPQETYKPQFAPKPKEQIDPIFTQVEFPEIEQPLHINVLPEIDPKSIPMTLPNENPAPKSEISKEVRVVQQPSRGDVSPANENFELTPIKNEPVVQVIETHTYKTELNSSVRVVSELEWAKNLIQQHHEAIRQLQQGLRTQQDNFDTITENLMRVNTTHNSRISQLAQQQLQQNQAADLLKKQINEQLIALQTKILNMPPQIIQMTSPEPHTSSPESKEKERKNSPKNSGRRKLDILPPLPAQSSRTSTPQEPVRTEPEKIEPNVSIEKIESERLAEPKPAPVQKKFTFSNVSFNTNFENQKAPIIVSSINTMSPSNHLDHIELFTSIAPSNKPSIPRIPQVERPKQVEPEVQPEITLPLGPPPVAPKPNVHVQNDIYVNRIPTRQAAINNVELGSDMMDMIEEKVTVIARKVVTILADSAKADMKEQANEMKKTVDKFVSLVDNKIDREFVEKMFNKFRVMLNEMNEKIENLQCSFLEWVTRDELEMVLQKFVGVVQDVKDAAATKTKYNCLLCGRPRNHLAGMMIDVGKKNSTSNDNAPTRHSVGGNSMIKPTIHHDLSTTPTDQASTLNVPPRDVVQFLTQA